MHTRPRLSFGHNFGHGRSHAATELADALGLLRTEGWKLVTTFDTPGTMLMWRGSNGEWYRHQFDDWGIGVGDDEFKALQVKVRLSTC